MNQLKALRTEFKLSLSEVAEKLGYAKTTISQYERGARSLSLEVRERFSKFYQVSRNYIIGQNKKNDLCIEVVFKGNRHKITAEEYELVEQSTFVDEHLNRRITVDGFVMVLKSRGSDIPKDVEEAYQNAVLQGRQDTVTLGIISKLSLLTFEQRDAIWLIIKAFVGGGASDE